MRSLLPQVELLKAALGEECLAPATWRNLTAVAALLPESIVNAFGLEISLDAAVTGADFSVSLHGPKTAVSQWRQFLQENPTLDRTPFAACERLLAAWAEPDGLQDIQQICLEFDTSEIACPLVPSVFVGPAFRIRFHRPTLLERAHEAYALLQSSPMPAATAATLAALVTHAMPPLGVGQFGWMLSRQPSPLRLVFACLTGKQIEDCLKAFDYAAPEVAERFVAFGQRPMQLDIDISDSVGTKIGIELVALPEQKIGAGGDAILEWMQALSSPIPTPLRGLVERWCAMPGKCGINHAKLTYQGASLVSRKLYLLSDVGSL